MRRLLTLAYGVACYAVFFATFCYAVGFIGGFAVPVTLDGAPRGSLAGAIAVNLALLGAFAVQHSVMARPGFKRWWTRIVPQPLERSTYVLFASVAMIVLFWQWRPMGGTLWNVEDPAARGVLYGAFGVGWLIVLASTFLIDHFELFGLRQAWSAFRGREFTPPRFVTPGPYRFIRHPLYLGWLIVFWAAPTMSTARLLFALLSSAYIFVGIWLEERDLVTVHGDTYARYRARVPMILPFRRPARRAAAA